MGRKNFDESRSREGPSREVRFSESDAQLNKGKPKTKPRDKEYRNNNQIDYDDSWMPDDVDSYLK